MINETEIDDCGENFILYVIERFYTSEITKKKKLPINRTYLLFLFYFLFL